MGRRRPAGPAGQGHGRCFASGRFLGVEDGAAVFAVPDKHLLARCEEIRADAEAALAARFGRPVPLRLVLDPGGPARCERRGRPGPPPTTSTSRPPDDFDLDDLEDAGPAVTSPEQRLLEAFPGAEEVSP